MNFSRPCGAHWVPLSLGLACAILNGTAHADVKLSSMFTDNMVLQRDISIPVWGTADPGEAVLVKLGESNDETNGKTNAARTVAGKDGQWKVMLAPQGVAKSLQLTATGKNVLAFRNVALGDVWLCSGQSNMGFSVERATNAVDEIKAADFPDIRLFGAAHAAMLTPQSDLKGKWEVCSPQTVGSFSAVAYYFGREIHRSTGVPIGLINSSWGGTVAEAWTSREALEKAPDLKGLVEIADKLRESYPANKEKYDKETLVTWQAAVDAARAQGKTIPTKPSPPTLPTDQNRATNLYNGMIAPIVPYGIKGVIWHQGESNARRAEQYRTLFPTLIRDWRNRFGQGDFPFYWVQLANYRALQSEPVEMVNASLAAAKDDWPMLREAQARTLLLPKTGMATAIDLADTDKPGDIHPHNKQDVGKRLALIALAKDYGIKTPFSGPTFVSSQVQGNKMHLTFKATDGGLKAKGDKLAGFAIAGASGDWKWADATIEGDDVVVSSAEVKAPVAARYAWATNPIGNLINGAGLPAVPFRTDTLSPN
jgi:sialate O-acetylesterase